MERLREDAWEIIRRVLAACQPGEAVERALAGADLGTGRVFLVAVGKAAWEMASRAAELLGERLEAGVVVTKHRHSRGPIPRCAVYEGGHPVPDEGSFRGTRAAMELVSGLSPEDRVVFLVSGGGSALFEVPLIPPEELARVTRELLAGGADIVEINTVRKRLSAVKGGRFARLCAPARVISVLLSDVLGDPPDMIASGPAAPDRSTVEEALAAAEKYSLTLSAEARSLLRAETPKALDNVDTVVAGGVGVLCAAAAAACRELGYRPVLLTDRLCCEAREAGSFLASVARTHRGDGEDLAFLAGGETVVHLAGSGLGGRNQELALAAAPGLAGLTGVLLFSLGSDGTDGPTDAAGGMVDGETSRRLGEAGLSVDGVLRENDSYHALDRVGCLIRTGPTGTNVNDLAAVLIRGRRSG